MSGYNATTKYLHNFIGTRYAGIIILRIRSVLKLKYKVIIKMFKFVVPIQTITRQPSINEVKCLFVNS